MRVKMGFGLFDHEEGVVALAIRHQSIELQALQRQKNQVGGAETGVANAARAIVNQ